MEFSKALGQITEKDLRILWRISHALAEVEGYGQIGEILFNEMKVVTPCEMGVIVPVNLIKDAHIQDAIYTKNVPRSAETIARYNERYYTLDPFCQRLDRRHYNQAVTETDIMKRVEYENGEFYNDFLKPQGIRHNMSMTVTAMGRKIGSVVFPNTSKTYKCGLKEKSALTLLAPALAGALFRTAIRDGYFHIPTSSVLAQWLRQFDLSKREGEIVGLVIEGLSNKAIGETLHISEKTVKTHMSSIMKKTGVNSRAALMSSILNRNPSVFDL